MARESKKDQGEMSVESKLKALYQLQTMLSEIDKIKTLRGELPLEVQDLEDEVAGLSTRIEKIQNEIAELKSNVATKRIEIETAKDKYDSYLYPEFATVSLMIASLSSTILSPGL